MNLRSALLAALALTLALLVAPATSSALTPPFDVRASKSADGRYTDASQNATIRPGKTKLFFWEVESGSLNNQSMTFDDAATDSNAGYKIKWYKGKKPKASKNISSQVKNPGYPFTLRARGDEVLHGQGEGQGGPRDPVPRRAGNRTRASPTPTRRTSASTASAPEAARLEPSGLRGRLLGGVELLLDQPEA